MNKAAKNAPDASASAIPAKRIGSAEDMAAAAFISAAGLETMLSAKHL